MPEENLGPYPLNTIQHGDALKLMPQLPADSLDLIVTDPPFAINFKAQRANYNRKGSRVLEGYNEIAPEDYPEFTLNWMKEAWRLLKPEGSMYVISGWTNLKDILNALDDVGFTTVNHLIWKYQFGVFTKKKYVTSHYHILFVTKDKKNYYFDKVEHYPEDVWVIKREYWHGKKKTPTKLPLALVKKILSFSSKEGDIVFDPFMGSGTVAAAAQEMGRRFFGFEIVEDYQELARERVSQTQEDL